MLQECATRMANFHRIRLEHSDISVRANSSRMSLILTAKTMSVSPNLTLLLRPGNIQKTKEATCLLGCDAGEISPHYRKLKIFV